MKRTSRRQFVSGAAAGAVIASSPVLSAPAIHAIRRRSDELRVAVVGVRGRGSAHIQGFEAIDGVSVVALCDVDAKVLAQRSTELAASSGREILTATDLRELLVRDDIDVISIATPNHLHALQTIWSCEAGKDVYVEKPVSHNIWEGAQMVAAARKHDRIVQAGMQSRSSGAIRDAIKWFQEGNLGEVTHAWGTCFKPRQSIGKVEGPQPVPEGVDWPLYMGPRGTGPLMRKRLHYDWHWQSHTGNGDLGNQGVHQLDIARWGLGQEALPKAALSIGGRFGYDDDGDTPNTMITFFDYEPAPLLFEVRGLPKNAQAMVEPGAWGKSMDRRLGSAVGATLHASGGHIVIPNYRSAKAFNAEGKEVKVWKGADDHYANFVAAVKSRDASQLNADIRIGHVSSAACHMGNNSLTLGRPMAAAEIERSLANEPVLAHSFDRMVAHLGACGIDLGATPLTFGARLALDPATEAYENDPRANELRKGTYAEGFAIPEVG